MTKPGKQWVEQDLRVTEVREREEFQLRDGPLDRAYVHRLRQRIDDGETLPPVKVAQVGAALYLVDGFHRLEAHRRASRGTVRALVARMSLPAAREEARRANTEHGKPLSRADKRKLWEAVVAANAHRDAAGALKSPRVISQEINRVISHTTIRRELKALGLEGELEPVKPWGGEPADEATLAAERREDAEVTLHTFGELVRTLDDQDRGDLLEAARALLEALEHGEVDTILERTAGRLDI